MNVVKKIANWIANLDLFLVLFVIFNLFVFLLGFVLIYFVGSIIISIFNYLF